MAAMDLLQVRQEESHLVIDARDAIRAGRHPRHEILALVKEAPSGTLCEIHVPHRTSPLIAALEELGLRVAVAEVEPFHFRLRMMKF